MSATNLAELVRSAATSAAADRPALVEGDESVTWAELDARVEAMAAGLLGRGLAGGDRVALLLVNGIGFAVAYFGALRAGLVAVPLNPAYTAPELAALVTDAEPVLTITSSELAPRLPGTPVIELASPEWDELLAAAPTGRGPGASGEDLAVLLYTSGTTGQPRGAMLSHRALLANLDQLARIEPPVVAPDDVVLLVLPLSHVYGLNAGLGLTAYRAATGVLADRFDPVDTLRIVRDAEVTNVVGAPPMYVAWALLPDLGDSLSGLRLAVSGSAPLPSSVLTAFREASGHTVFEGYGLTEAAPVVTTTLCSDVAKPASVGRPLPGVDVRILDEHDDEVAEEGPGELVVRGENLFSGYWPDGAGGPDAEGWWRTGDIAYADADGDLFIAGRVRELVLVSGFNVYPSEVEQVLVSHRDVVEAAVVGVAHPYTGETVKAYVVAAPGAVLDGAGLIEYAAGRLARFKCPTTVEVVDSLPHSTSGKVAKRLLTGGRSSR